MMMLTRCISETKWKKEAFKLLADGKVLTTLDGEHILKLHKSGILVEHKSGIFSKKDINIEYDFNGIYIHKEAV